MPSILLMNRSSHVIGRITHYDNWHVSIVAVGMDEIVFDVHKYTDGRPCPVWDDLVDLKLVEVEGFGRFEISVSYADRAETVKSVHGFSLEVELAQINLHDFHVNDEEATDMRYTEYSKDNYDKDGSYIPTTFYNPTDTGHSLLHRVLADKAPHWSIGYVTPYIALGEDVQPEDSSTFQRTYTVDGTSIYDFLTGTVAEESNVAFVFDTIGRKINCYSLCDCIDQDSGDVLCKGIGEDTFVFVSKDRLANETSINSNKDKVKNCFRIEGGDDVINAMVAAANMGGNSYIYQFADFQYNDMSERLRKKIQAYQKMMESKDTQDTYYGENGIYTRLCRAYDDLGYFESSMMPNTDKVKEPGAAKAQYDRIFQELDCRKNEDSAVAVSSMDSYSGEFHAGVTNNIEAYARVFLDSRFDLEVIRDTTAYSYAEDAETKRKTGTWAGKIKITQHTDKNNAYPIDISSAPELIITVNDDELEFAKQKIYKALSEGSMADIDFDMEGIWGDKSLTEEEKTQKISNYFNQYSLNRLDSFVKGYDSCISILSTLGLTVTSDTQDTIYSAYFKRKSIAESVRAQRQKQVDGIYKLIEDIQTEQRAFQYGGKCYEGTDKEKEYEPHDFRTYLASDGLYKEFCSYRREDTYTNSNYTSEGLSDSECLEKARELIEAATKEAKKACVIQRTVNTSLNNLFALPEFESLHESFAMYNYIRVRTDDEILKLRLIGMEFMGESPEKIEVTFSEQVVSVEGRITDLQSVIKQARSMATSYPYTTLQARQGADAKNEFKNMYEEGLNASKTMLTNNDNNEITIEKSGIICKRMDDEGHYGDKQMRITGNIMAFTDDNWKNVRMAIGETMFKDPKDPNGKYRHRYGIVAENIVGKYTVSESSYIGNKDGNVLITSDGIEISNGIIMSSDYKIHGENHTNASIIDLSEGTFSFAGGKLKYKNNKLSVNGEMTADSGDIGGWSINGNSIIKTDENGSFMQLDSNNKSLISYDENTKMKTSFSNAKISFKNNDTSYLEMYITNWKDRTEKGLNFYSDKDNKYVCFGYDKIASDGKYEPTLVLNYGLNPNGDTQDVLIYGNTLMNGDIDISGCINDSLYISKNSSNNTVLASSHNDLVLQDKVIVTDESFRPTRDWAGDIKLGISNCKWSEIWCKQNSLTSNSDKNLKNSIKYMNEQDKLGNFFLSLSPCTYKFNDGKSGRTHFGFISQDVEQALAENDMTAYDFAGFCKDVKTETYVDEKGREYTKEVLSEDGEPEYIYSLRYGEFIALNTFMIQNLSKEIQNLKNEKQDLHEEINDLKRENQNLIERLLHLEKIIEK